MINREDMLELSRRMTPARTHFDRIAGAYFDEEGFVDGTFNTHFLKLSTTEKKNKLEIAKAVVLAETNEQLKDYRIPEILSGSLDESVTESLCTLAAHAPTDERLTVSGLLLDGWNTLFLKFREEDQFTVTLQGVLRQARDSLLEGNTLAAFTEQYRTSQKIRLENHLLDRTEADHTERIARILEQSLSRTQQERISAPEEVIAILRHALEENVSIRQDTVNQTSLALHLGFSFADSAFGDGPEILFLISDLSHNANAVSFISHFGCEEYFRFNKKLKFQEERQNLLQEIDSVIKTV